MDVIVKETDFNNVIGTSFYNRTINASVNELISIFGIEPVKDFDNKTKFEWRLEYHDETLNKKFPFTIYDYNEYWDKYADNYTGVCLGYKAVQVNPPYPTYFFEILPNQHLPIVGGAYPENGKEYVHLMKVKYDNKNRIDYKLFRSWDKNERNKDLCDWSRICRSSTCPFILHQVQDHWLR